MQPAVVLYLFALYGVPHGGRAGHREKSRTYWAVSDAAYGHEWHITGASECRNQAMRLSD